MSGDTNGPSGGQTCRAGTVPGATGGFALCRWNETLRTIAVMGMNGGAYKLVLVLHILSAIAGFGGVLLNGLYAHHAKQRRGAEGLAIIEANFHVSEMASRFIYAVPVFGVLLVWLSDGAWSFSHTWVWMTIVIYAVAMTISHQVMRPTVQRIMALMREMASVPVGGAPAGPPPQVAEIQALGAKAGATGAVLHFALVAALVLMVWKPGA